jgi:hypothetical protein
MKLNRWIACTAMAAGVWGCGLETEEPIDEATAEQWAELETSPGGAPAAPGAESTSELGRPSDHLMRGGSEPSGPTPYPWREDGDPGGGPSPYPWEGDPAGEQTGPHAQPSGTNAGTSTQTQSSTN